MQVFYDAKPDKLLYCQLNGEADAWLRRNIKKVKDDEGNAAWQAEEEYLHTTKEEAWLTEHFDVVFTELQVGSYKEEEAETTDPTEAEAGKEQEAADPSVNDRLDAIEAAIMELAELIMEE